MQLRFRNVIVVSFSCEVWVKANQKNAMQQGGECGMGKLYLFASQLASVKSSGTQPNSQVLPSVYQLFSNF